MDKFFFFKNQLKLRTQKKKDTSLPLSEQSERSRKSYYLTVAVLCLFCIVIYYPGFFSGDSFDQWQQSQANRYSTWHPIIMSVTWRYISKLFGVGSYFILNQIMYWFGLALFIDVSLGRRLRYLAIAFFPPLVMISFSVWKDVTCMTEMVIATALFIIWTKQKKTWLLILSGAFLILACLVRWNGYIPAATLVAVGAFCFFYDSSLKKIATAFFLALVLAAFTNGTGSLLNEIYKPHVSRPLASLLLWDIAGIYVNEGILNAELPTFVHITNQEKAKTWLKGYSPQTNSICWSSGISCANKTLDEDITLIKFWFDKVRNHPKAYLKHRLNLAKHLYGFRHRIYYPYEGFNQNCQKGGIFAPGPAGKAFYRHMNRAFHALESSRLFHPWIWILLCLVMSVWLLIDIFHNKNRQQKSMVAMALASSGLANAVSLFFISTAADYRYLVWTLLSGILSILLLCSRSLKNQIDNPINGTA